jgi:hypothetical protein
MTSEHIRKVIEFMERENAKNRTKEDAFKRLQACGILNSRGEYTTPYRNLGRWIEKCNGKKWRDIVEIKEEKL